MLDIKLLRDTVFIHGMPANKALRQGLAMLNDIDLRESLKELKMPFLRLYGRLDSLVPKTTAEAVKELTIDSPQITYPKAGHAPFLSHRKEFVKDLKEFLNA